MSGNDLAAIANAPYQDRPVLADGQHADLAALQGPAAGRLRPAGDQPEKEV